MTKLNVHLGWFHEKMKINDARVQRMRKVCAKYPIEKSFEIVPQYGLFLETPKFVGCAMAKVGSTSLRHTIKDLRQTVDKAERKGKYFKLDNPLQHEEYKKFILIRDPLERLASSYNDKIVTMGNFLKRKGFDKTVKQMSRFIIPDRYKPKSGISFDDFLSTVVIPSQHTHENYGRHWAPFYKLCAPCSVQYDYIERLDETNVRYICFSLDFLQDVILNFSVLICCYGNRRRNGLE